MADLSLAPLGVVAAYLVSRAGRIPYFSYVLTGAVVLTREGREWTREEAAALGKTIVWKACVDFLIFRWTRIDWPGVWQGLQIFRANLRQFGQWAIDGAKRDWRYAKAWVKGLFTDRNAERIAIGHERFEEAGLRRAALFTSEAYDFEPIVWDGLPVDPDHARARDEYEHLARKPQLSSAEGSQLALVLLSLQNYGDNPLAIRRGGVATATVAPQGFLAAGTALAAVTGGWAWIAPRALVALAIALVVVGLQWRSADRERDLLQVAMKEVRGQYEAAARGLEIANVEMDRRATACLVQITKAAEATKTKLAAESAARKRRQARAQEQAAAGGAAPILDPREWMRGIAGQNGGDDTAAPAAPNPGPVSDGSAGAAAPVGAGDLPSEPGGPAEGAGGGR